MNGMLASVRALPLCFVIYVIEAGLSLLVSLPLTLEFGRSLSFARDVSATAIWLERIVALGPMLRGAALSLALAAGALLLIGPWLHMAWLSSLRGGESVASALAHGARLWLRALSVSLWVLLGLALLLAPFGFAAAGVARWLDHHPNDRVHDLAVLGCVLPALPILLLGQVWHDLARARALEQNSLAAASRSARAALRPGLWLRALLWSAAGWAAVLAAQWCAKHLGDAPLLVIVVLQGAALLRLLLRGAWLADALACADAHGASGASEFP